VRSVVRGLLNIARGSCDDNADPFPYLRGAGGFSFSATGSAGAGVSVTRPSSLRTRSSSFLQRSGFSRRNCFAFSRPWPSRSLP